MKYAEVHNHKANFKNQGEKYWVVGYDGAGIGTPLYDVDEDVKWFIENQKASADDKFILAEKPTKVGSIQR